MVIGTYGDSARWLSGANQGSRIKAKMDTLSLELASGQKADLAKHLGTDTTRLSEIDSLLSRMSALQQNATTADTILRNQQTALSRFEDASSSLTNAVTHLSPNLTKSSADTITYEAQSAFGAMVSSLNTNTSGRFLFAGSKTDTPPLPHATTILADLKTAIDLTQPIATIIDDIGTYFEDPAGAFESTHYSGGSGTGMVVKVGTHTEVNTGTTALDPGLRSSLAKTAALALMAELPQQTKREELVAQLRTSLHADAGAIDLQAKIGAEQERIEKERAFMAGEETALTIERNKRVSADQFETATQLKQAEIQLEVHFTLLNRMSKLSLVNFS